MNIKWTVWILSVLMSGMVWSVRAQILVNNGSTGPSRTEAVPDRLGATSLEAGPAGLTFEERVACQRAIEAVYWRHRIWPKENLQPKPPLAEVMSEAALRAKVAEYLKQSEALAVYWQRPITGGQLQAEMERMARQTWRPERLTELWAALGNDPFLRKALHRPNLPMHAPLQHTTGPVLAGKL